MGEVDGMNMTSTSSISPPVNKIRWESRDDTLKAVYTNPEDANEVEATWAPQDGSQDLFLRCPVFEVLFTGTRGPGKTDALLMDFAKNVGKGYKEEWRGILFRRTYPELSDVIDKSKKWFSKIFPRAKFNESKNFWLFPDGEKLFFRHFERPADYYSYHGHAYPWIAWEELTTWPDDKCYKSMMSCARSTIVGVPITVRATTNPYGIGHNWVKSRFRLPVPPNKKVGKIIYDSVDQDDKPEPPRVAIHGDLNENKILLHSNPDYIDRIRASARNNSELQAWLYGSWDIVAGGMFDDIWCDYRDKIIVPRFEIPKTWRIDRSFDWGSSKPFSVGWWAVSDGGDVLLPNNKVMSTMKGDLFRINEWYGWSGTPNEGTKMLVDEIAKGILKREKSWGMDKGRVVAGPADSSIFDEENGNCIATDFQNLGIYWEKADKKPGSRKQGWEQVRKRLKATYNNGAPREEAGLFIFDHCTQWTRTVPCLPRDDKDIDDVDTEAEDHIGDDTRYRVRFESREIIQSKSIGMF
jgi:hypothetical protein